MSNYHDLTHGSKAVPPSALEGPGSSAARRVAFYRHGPERHVRVERNPTTGKLYDVIAQTIHSEAIFLRNGDVRFTQFGECRYVLNSLI